MAVYELPAIVFDGVIDVSHHNGAIDWPAVADAGIALAFIKATQGAGFVDPAFERNRRAAISAGVLVVPYHFLDTSDPDRQAAHFLAATDLAAAQPAMLDWETAATVAAMVTIGRAVADRTARDPVGYYGFAQLQEAEPGSVALAADAAGISARHEFGELRQPGPAARRVCRRAVRPRGTAGHGPMIFTNTPRPGGSPASRPRSTARSGSGRLPISGRGSPPARCRRQ